MTLCNSYYTLWSIKTCDLFVDELQNKLKSNLLSLLRYVTTLPCEIRMFNCITLWQLINAQVMQNHLFTVNVYERC